MEEFFCLFQLGWFASAGVAGGVMVDAKETKVVEVAMVNNLYKGGHENNADIYAAHYLAINYVVTDCDEKTTLAAILPKRSEKNGGRTGTQNPAAGSQFFNGPRRGSQVVGMPNAYAQCIWFSARVGIVW